MEKEELKTMLTDFRDGIVTTIETKSKEQSDAATKDIAELRGKLTEAEKALATVQEEIKKNKSFGLPGLEEELKSKKFHWGKYFIGLAKTTKRRKGLSVRMKRKNSGMVKLLLNDVSVRITMRRTVLRVVSSYRLRFIRATLSIPSTPILLF